MVPVPIEVEQWKKKRSDYDKLWLQLLAAIKGSDIEPIFVDCFRSPNEVLTDAVKKTEGKVVLIIQYYYNKETPHIIHIQYTTVQCISSPTTLTVVIPLLKAAIHIAI